MKLQEIRAVYDRHTITVYQAYREAIAVPALKNGHFVPPFSLNRMTWIKPSYLWMMERSNWAQKSGQEFILAIKIKRDYWEKALSLGVLTHPDPAIYASGAEWDEKFKTAPVHIQWDPERSLNGTKLQVRSIQVGISRFLIEEYNTKWIESITYQTPLTKKISRFLKEGKHKEAKRLLPEERVYPLPTAIGQIIGIR